MDKLENYRLYIQNLLESHSHFKSQDDVQSELIFDTVRDRHIFLDLLRRRTSSKSSPNHRNCSAIWTLSDFGGGAIAYRWQTLTAIKNH